MPRKRNDPLDSRERRASYFIYNQEIVEVELHELSLSEEVKGLLEVIWDQGIYYVRGLMELDPLTFQWAIEMVKVLDPLV